MTNSRDRESHAKSSKQQEAPVGKFVLEEMFCVEIGEEKLQLHLVVKSDKETLIQMIYSMLLNLLSTSVCVIPFTNKRSSSCTVSEQISQSGKILQ